MLELLTTFNVYCYLQKFTPWILSIIKLCDLAKKHMLHLLSTNFFICLVPFPDSSFSICPMAAGFKHQPSSNEYLSCVKLTITYCNQHSFKSFFTL